MTALAFAAGRRPPHDLARWGVCFALVAAIHAGIVIGLVRQRVVSPDTGDDLPAIMVDMAPPPAAPSVAPLDTPPSEAVPDATTPDPVLDSPPDVPDPEMPGPDVPPPAPMVMAEVPALPPVPAAPPLEATLAPSPVVQPKAEVALPPPQRLPKPPLRETRRSTPREQPVERRPPRPIRAQRGAQRIERRPPASAAGARTTASLASTSSGASSAANRASWQSALVAHLRRSLHPQGSQSGQAAVRFSMSRSGQVLSTSLVRSAGSPSLDQEALAVFRRAQPLPPPPTDVPGATFTFTIPIRFTSR